MNIMHDLRFLLCVCALIILGSCSAGCMAPDQEPIKGDITVVKGSTEVLLTYEEIMQMAG